MTFAFLLTWWNLVYLTFLGLSTVFLIAQIAGIDGDMELGSIEGGADLHLEAGGDFSADGDTDIHLDVDGDTDIHLDVDGDTDIHLDVDGDTDMHLDVDGDTDMHLDVDADMGIDSHGNVDPDTILPARLPRGSRRGLSPLVKILHFAGIGRVPLSLWAMAMCLTFGISGLGLNAFLGGFIASPSLFFPISFFFSLALSFVVAGSASRIVARFMPKTSSHGTTMKDLEGAVGKLLYSLKPGKTGTARVRDRSGNLIQCSVFTEDVNEIRSGESVLLIRYVKKDKAFEVEIAPTELLSLPED